MGTANKRSLKEILDSEYVENSDDEVQHGDSDHDVSDNEEAPLDPSICEECRDMKFEIICKDCQENFCVICYEMIQRW